MILGRIDPLIRFGPSRIDLAVPIGIDNPGAPALGSFGIMGLVPGIDINPGDSTANPKLHEVIFANLVMIRAKARVDVLPLACLGIVDSQLTITLL